MKLHKSLLTLIACCLFTTFAFAEKSPRKAYINRYKKLAITEMNRTGIPASITLAQGLLESGNGKSTLATKANNHFGIKCHDWTGPSIEIDDDKKDECFRKYKDPYQSYKDHSEFLTTRSRYAFLFKLRPTDYKGWAKGLKKAGYATHPKYAHMLIDIIQTSPIEHLIAILVIERVNVTEHDQQIGVNLAGDKGAQPVVVAECGSDLVGADAVILV